ncbi:hypothetical protein BC828DRAFT_407367 [Blastocladiella britannica]|nr:hypothetical protein BC828DRAFT_407367 [Blastocladiella britannica]
MPDPPPPPPPPGSAHASGAQKRPRSPLHQQQQQQQQLQQPDTAAGTQARTPATKKARRGTTTADAANKRKKVNHACVYCRRSHMTCDNGRPCQRCIKRHIGHLCHDEARPPSQPLLGGAPVLTDQQRQQQRHQHLQQVVAAAHQLGSHPQQAAAAQQLMAPPPTAASAAATGYFGALAGMDQVAANAYSAAAAAGLAVDPRTGQIVAAPSPPLAPQQQHQHHHQQQSSSSQPPSSAPTATSHAQYFTPSASAFPSASTTAAWPLHGFYTTGLPLGGLTPLPFASELAVNEFSVISDFAEQIDPLRGLMDFGFGSGTGTSGPSPAGHTMASYTPPQPMPQPPPAPPPPPPPPPLTGPTHPLSREITSRSAAEDRLRMPAQPAQPPAIDVRRDPTAPSSPTTAITAPGGSSRSARNSPAATSSSGGGGAGGASSAPDPDPAAVAAVAAAALIDAPVPPTPLLPGPTRPPTAAVPSSTHAPDHPSALPPGAPPRPRPVPGTTDDPGYLERLADPVADSIEARLKAVITAKYEAGQLRPYNYARGYARLQRYLEGGHVSVASRHRVMAAIAGFRPALRATRMQLTDVDLVLVEESFERLLLDYDHLFSAMGVPAALWRRTGEIYKANHQFADLVGLPLEALREGRVSVYELMGEDAAVNYWEKYGGIAFDPGQKAVLTSCVLLYQDGKPRITPLVDDVPPSRPGQPPVPLPAKPPSPPKKKHRHHHRPHHSRDGSPSSTASSSAAGSGSAMDVSSAAAATTTDERSMGSASANNPSGSGNTNSTNSSSASGSDSDDEEDDYIARPIPCCFSFTIRRDKYNMPIMIVGNFLPVAPALVPGAAASRAAASFRKR